MTIQEYLRIIRERWKIVAIALLVGIIGAATVFILRPPEYTAQVSLYISSQSGSDPQQAYQGAQLSEQRVKSYNQLVTGDRVMADTIARLQLPLTTRQLASRVSASSALDSVIISISATDDSPAGAARIANTVGEITTGVVDELERPSTPGGSPPIAIRLIQPAQLPVEPSSAGLTISLAIGALVGLAVGLAAAFLRNSLDLSIKTAAALAHVADSPNLGSVAFDSRIPEKPLIVYEDPRGPRAEAFRQIRTNLQFVDVDQPRKIIVVTSSLPNEGKTTSVINLAIALAAAENRVLVIEGDLRRPKLSELLGLDRSVGLTNVLAGRVQLRDAVQHWARGHLDILSSGPIPPNPSELLASNQMRTLLDNSRTEYDVVLVDSPPLLPVTDAAAVAAASDGVLFICRYKKTSRNEVISAIGYIRAVSADVLGTVLTMVPQSELISYAKYAQYRAHGNGSSLIDTSRPTPAPRRHSVSRRPTSAASRDTINDPEATARMHDPSQSTRE